MSITMSVTNKNSKKTKTPSLLLEMIEEIATMGVNHYVIADDP